MLHRLRLACASNAILLSGIVEIDEPSIIGKEKNKKEGKTQKVGRGPVGKQPVLGVRQRGGTTIAKPLEGTDQRTLHRDMHQHVDPDSIVWTDAHRSYQGLAQIVSSHDTVKRSVTEYVKGFVHTNGMESVGALLKRGIHGTDHQGSVKHLHRSANEFAFRLNEGNCEGDTADRMKALFSAMSGNPVTYKTLTA